MRGLRGLARLVWQTRFYCTGGGRVGPVLARLDGQQVQVVPNKLSILVENCELRGLKEGQPPPLWRLRTFGMEEYGDEMVMIRARDLLRPRDHSMLLALFSDLYESVRLGQVLDEGTAVPLETVRQVEKRTPLQTVSPYGFDHLAPSEASQTQPEEEIHLWLMFYRHPKMPGKKYLLFVEAEERSFAKEAGSPLRLTNLMFKRNSWSYVDPSVYVRPELPGKAAVEESCLHGASPLPGASVTVQDEVVTVSIPATPAAQNALRQQSQQRELLLVASRHAPDVDGLLCWDPSRPFDSFVVSTSPQIDSPTSSQPIGATFVHVCLGEGEEEESLLMVEDGVRVSLPSSLFRSFTAKLLDFEDVQTEKLRVVWDKHARVSVPSPVDDPGDAEAVEEKNQGEEEGGGEDLDDWLGYVKRRLAEENLSVPAGEQKQPRASKQIPELRHVKTEVRPVETKQQQPAYKTQHKPSPAVEEVSAEQRTTVEPRLVKADFFGMEGDPQAQDEAWEAYVIRVATVLSGVFSHAARRRRPTRGTEEPASVKVEIEGGRVVEVYVDESVCSMELAPQGLQILKDQINKRCNKPPHPMRLAMWFSL